MNSARRHTVIAILCTARLLASPGTLRAGRPDGDATIRAAAGDSEIVITTTARLAGAIDSLTWNGREFLDSFDHGRQLQSASNLDCNALISDETFNPHRGWFEERWRRGEVF